MKKKNKYLLTLINAYGTAMHGAGRMDVLDDFNKYTQYMNDSTAIFNKILDILENEKKGEK